MLETVLPLPFWLELAATLAGAVSGAMSASRERLDLFGTITVAFIVGLCGGVIRDVLLQDYGIYAFQNPQLILGCIVCGVVVFYFARLVLYLDIVLEAIDTLAVGLWAIIGAGKAFSAGWGVIPSVMMGVVTAIGGGILRDMMLDRPVSSFQPSSYYGIAAAIGALVFVLARSYHILDEYSAVLCVALCILIRLASLAFGWKTKPSRDLFGPMADALNTPIRALQGKDTIVNFSRNIIEDDEDGAVDVGKAKRQHHGTKRAFNKQNKTRHRHR